MAIAPRPARRLDRPAGPDVATADRLDAELGHLAPGDLAGRALLDAVADYAAGHEPASVRRVLSTWRGFGRHLVAADVLLSNPVDGLMGPKRPEWVPKALEYAELERIAQPAGSPDPRARDPWPERDSALLAVFRSAPPVSAPRFEGAL